MLNRNIGRGFADVALFETGLVFQERPGGPQAAPILPVDRAPTEAEQVVLQAALPGQPLRLGVVLAGNREQSGWWGPGPRGVFEDAIEAARDVLGVSEVPFEVRAAQHEPWHPGRCAALYVHLRQSGQPGRVRR